MTLNGFGTASGKIILMGEHAVVYGKPAIALPFNKARIETIIEFHDDAITIECDFYSGCLFDAPESLSGIKCLIEETLKELHKTDIGFHIGIFSSVPPRRGLGSSAAVSVSVVRSIYDAFNISLEDETLKRLVNTAEQIHHTNPSGLDANTIASGKPVFFEHGSLPDILDVEMDAYLVVADTGIMGKTREAVESVRVLYDRDNKSISLYLDYLGHLTQKTRNYLIDKDIRNIGSCMSQAHEILRTLCVSNDTLDGLTDVALEHGALGAKLTGSGLGGCMIALCETELIAEDVERALRDAGAIETWSTSLKGDGNR